MTKRKHPKEHVYFSGINKEKERFETLPSEVGFDHRDFAIRIQEAINEIGISVEELSISTYITADKLRAYFRGKQFLNFTERRAVGKALGF